MAIADSGLAQFLATSAGRTVRAVVGIALVVWGYWLSSAAGIILIVVGLLPLIAGVFDLCFLTALLGGPFRGAEIRKRAR